MVNLVNEICSMEELLCNFALHQMPVVENKLQHVVPHLCNSGMHIAL